MYVPLAFAHAGSGFAALVANVSGANLAAAHVDLCVRGEGVFSSLVFFIRHKLLRIGEIQITSCT